MLPPLASRRVACAMTLTLGALSVGGCLLVEGPPHIHGPGPSDRVSAASGAPSAQLVNSVECSGPADQLVRLASLCESQPMGWTRGVGDMSFVVGDGGPGPQLLVLGYFTGAGDRQGNHAADIRYAAFVLEGVDATGAVPRDFFLLTHWREGTPISGSVTTNIAFHGACTTSLDGDAEFLIDDTTVRVRFSMAIPC